MFQRSAQPSSSSHARADDTFVDDVADLHAENLLSAQRASKLLKKACNAGINVPRQPLRGSGKNHARAFRRMRMHRSKWPSEYWFDCRVQDRKSKKEHVVKVCILLPQEVLHCLWALGNPEVLLERTNLDSDSLSHLEDMLGRLGADDGQGFGMNGDGIPCNYDRTESVIMININLPGSSGKNGRLRIPLSHSQTGAFPPTHTTT